MGAPPEDDVTRLVDGLRAGDEALAAAFYARYGPALARLADRNLEPGLRRRVAGDEVAHSACRTFLRRVRDGAFELDGGAALWGLLCAITLAKVRKQVRHHNAQRRAVGREVVSGDGDGRVGPEVLADGGPDPAEEAAFADVVQRFLDGLDGEARQVVCLKLEQRTDAEVGAAVGCSERTVRRLVQRARERLDALLADG